MDVVVYNDVWSSFCRSYFFILHFFSVFLCFCRIRYFGWFNIMEEIKLNKEDWQDVYDSAVKLAKKAVIDTKVFLKVAQEAEDELKELDIKTDST